MSMFDDSIGMLVIDLPDGGISVPFAQGDVLVCAELAKKQHGRLRMRMGGIWSTTDPSIGCLILGDWRPADD